MVEYCFSGTITERRGSRGAITAVSGAMPCKDGHWVISQIHRPGRWTKFVDWVRDPELSADPSLAEEENQHKRRDFIMERLDQWAKGFTKTELVEQAQRLHFPASPVSTTLDLVNDPQLQARGFIVAVDNARLGKVVLPNFPLQFTNAKLTRRWEFPVLGRDTETVLREVVGYDEATIAAHRQDGVLE